MNQQRAAALAALNAPTRRQQVIKAIEDGAATLQEVADAVGVTRQRVEQIVNDQLGSKREWAQQKLKDNRRASRGITAWGETKLLADWATDARAVVPRELIRQRVKAGWEPQEAITTPTGARPDPHPKLTEAEAQELAQLARLASTVNLGMPPDAAERVAALERDRLVRVYIGRGMRCRHLAEVCGVGLGTVYAWSSYGKGGWRGESRYKQQEENR